MIIHNKQDKERELDKALEARRNTVMVLSGGPKCDVVHTYTEQADALDSWQKCFLIADLGVLGQTEKDAWFGGDNPEKYAVLGGRELPKHVTTKGPIDDLVLPGWEADKVAISTAFA
jgi:hypothetical protein